MCQLSKRESESIQKFVLSGYGATWSMAHFITSRTFELDIDAAFHAEVDCLEASSINLSALLP